MLKPRVFFTTPMSIRGNVYLMQLACRTGMLFNSPKRGQAPLIGDLMGFTFDAYKPRGNLINAMLSNHIWFCVKVFLKVSSVHPSQFLNQFAFHNRDRFRNNLVMNLYYSKLLITHRRSTTPRHKLSGSATKLQQTY